MVPFEVTVDERGHAVQARLHGFWDVAATQAYLDALRIAAQRVAKGGARSWWLIDLSDMQTQSREVAELMGGQLRAIIPTNASLAVVAGSSLPMMQAKRVVAQETHRYFPTAADAQAWFDAEGRQT